MKRKRLLSLHTQRRRGLHLEGLLQGVGGLHDFNPLSYRFLFLPSHNKSFSCLHPSGLSSCATSLEHRFPFYCCPCRLAYDLTLPEGAWGVNEFLGGALGMVLASSLVSQGG